MVRERHGTVVLVGPVAVGKTTIGAALAARLRTPFVDVDDVADEVYDELGMGHDRLFAHADEHGAPAAFRWWEPALVAAATRTVEQHRGSVIAFGAGHSHFVGDDHARRVADALQAVTVVLLLGDPDAGRAIDLLRARSIEERDTDWRYGDVDFIADWVRSDQNRALADCSVVVGARPVSDVVDEIVAALPGV